MPRNASGSFTLVAGNPVVSDTVIETNWANPTLADIAQALTDSLDRYGRGAMVASVKFPDGTMAAPSIAFSAESSTGFYRAASKVLSASVNNDEVMRLEPERFTVKSAGVDLLKIEPTQVAVTPPTTFSSTVSCAIVPTSVEHMANKGYVDTQFSGAPGGGYLPLAGGSLTGNLAISRNQRAVLSLNTPDGAVNRRNGAVYMASNGDLNLVTTNDAGTVEQVALRLNPDGNLYLGTGAKFWHSSNDGAGSGLDADKLGGLAHSVTNFGNTHVTRDANGTINISSLYLAGLGLWNEGGSWRTTNPIFSSGTIKSGQSFEISGIYFANDGGWWSTNASIHSNLTVRGTDIVSNGGKHYGGSIRNPDTCTLGAENGHRFGFFWDGTYFAVCINNSVNKGFETWAYSDPRIKTDVRPSPVDALSVLRGLGVYAFDVKPDLAALLGEPKHHRVGMNAEEVQEVIPEAVAVLSSSDWMDPRVPGDLKQLRYSQLIPWLVKAMQQLADRVDDLQ